MQPITPPNSQAGHSSDEVKIPPKKKRVRKQSAAKGKLPAGGQLPAGDSRVLVVAQLAISAPVLAGGINIYAEMSRVGFAITADHLTQVREFLSWNLDGQHHWLQQITAQQLGLLLMAEHRNHEEQMAATAQRNAAQAAQQNAIQAAEMQHLQSMAQGNSQQYQFPPSSAASVVDNSSHNQVNTGTPIVAQNGRQRQRNSTKVASQSLNQLQQEQISAMVSQQDDAEENESQAACLDDQDEIPSFNEYPGRPVQYANIHQLMARTPQPHSTEYGTHQGASHRAGVHNAPPEQNGPLMTVLAGPYGRFYPGQEAPQYLDPNTFANPQNAQPFQTTPNLQSYGGYQQQANVQNPGGYQQQANFQNPGGYQQQVMVNGQLMNVSFQPVQGNQQNGQFNAQQTVPGAHSHIYQPNGTTMNNFNLMSQQNHTNGHASPPGQQVNNNGAMPPYVLPTLTHEMRVAEARLKSAAFRRKQRDLRANGQPPMKVPKGPPRDLLMLGGPGLGSLPQSMQDTPPPPSALDTRLKFDNWENRVVVENEPVDGQDNAQNIPRPNASTARTQNGNAAPPHFQGAPFINQSLLPPHVLNAIINQAPPRYGHPSHMSTPVAPGQNGVAGQMQFQHPHGTVMSSPQVQMPNSAGQLSIGPNAQGSTSPAGGANSGSPPQPRPRRRAPPKKAAKKTSNTMDNDGMALCHGMAANTGNAHIYQSSYAPPMFQAPNTQFGSQAQAMQTPAYTYVPQVNQASHMGAPVQATAPAATRVIASPPAVQTSAAPAAPTTPAPAIQRVAAPLQFPSTPMPSMAAASATAPAVSLSTQTPAAPVVPATPAPPIRIIVSPLTFPTSSTPSNYEIITPAEHAARCARAASPSSSASPAATGSASAEAVPEDPTDDFEDLLREAMEAGIAEIDRAIAEGAAGAALVSAPGTEIVSSEEEIDDLFGPMDPDFERWMADDSL